MSDINIRNVDEALIREAKIYAARQRQTLRDFVIQAIEQAVFSSVHADGIPAKPIGEQEITTTIKRTEVTAKAIPTPSAPKKIKTTSSEEICQHGKPIKDCNFGICKVRRGDV